MNLTIDLATFKDLASILRVRISAILNDARSVLSEEEVIEWIEKPKESEISEQIELGEIWVTRNKYNILAWI